MVERQSTGCFTVSTLCASWRFWTFNQTYSKPIVVDVNGKNLEEQLVGFNNSSFFGIGTSTTSENQNEIKSKSFEIVPEDKKGKKQYYHTNLSKLVDKEKIK